MEPNWNRLNRIEPNSIELNWIETERDRIQETRYSPDNIWVGGQKIHALYTKEEFQQYFGWWAGEVLFEAAPQDSIEIESNRTEIDWIESKRNRSNWN